MGGATLPRGVEARRSGSKAYLRIVFMYRGVRCRESLKTLSPDSKRDVKYAANLKAEIEARIERGTFDYAEYFPNSKRAVTMGSAKERKLVGELVDEFIEAHSRSLEPSTERNYRNGIKNFIKPHLAEVAITQLTTGLIRDALEQTDVTLKTMRNYLTPLRGVIERAIQDGLITVDPLQALDLQKLVPKEKKRVKDKTDPLDLNEIAQFLRVCREYRPEWENYWTFAFFTGLRTSELYGLRWQDVDWNKGTVNVEIAIVEGVEKGTKTENSDREVILPPAALEALRRQKAATFLRGGRVFLNPRDGSELGAKGKYQVSETCWKFIMQKSGLRYRNQYQTRHSYASNMLSGGENLLFVSKQMGHRDTQMVLRRYGRWISQAAAGQHEFKSEFGNFGQNAPVVPPTLRVVKDSPVES